MYPKWSMSFVRSTATIPQCFVLGVSLIAAAILSGCSGQAGGPQGKLSVQLVDTSTVSGSYTISGSLSSRLAKSSQTLASPSVVKHAAVDPTRFKAKGSFRLDVGNYCYAFHVSAPDDSEANEVNRVPVAAGSSCVVGPATLGKIYGLFSAVDLAAGTIVLDSILPGQNRKIDLLAIPVKNLSGSATLLPGTNCSDYVLRASSDRDVAKPDDLDQLIGLIDQSINALRAKLHLPPLPPRANASHTSRVSRLIARDTSLDMFALGDALDFTAPASTVDSVQLSLALEGMKNYRNDFSAMTVTDSSLTTAVANIVTATQVSSLTLATSTSSIAVINESDMATVSRSRGDGSTLVGDTLVESSGYAVNSSGQSALDASGLGSGGLVQASTSGTTIVSGTAVATMASGLQSALQSTNVDTKTVAQLAMTYGARSLVEKISDPEYRLNPADLMLGTYNKNIANMIDVTPSFSKDVSLSASLNGSADESEVGQLGIRLIATGVAENIAPKESTAVSLYSIGHFDRTPGIDAAQDYYGIPYSCKVTTDVDLQQVVQTQAP